MGLGNRKELSTDVNRNDLSQSIFIDVQIGLFEEKPQVSILITAGRAIVETRGPIPAGVPGHLLGSLLPALVIPSSPTCQHNHYGGTFLWTSFHSYQTYLYTYFSKTNGRSLYTNCITIDLVHFPCQFI